MSGTRLAAIFFCVATAGVGQSLMQKAAMVAEPLVNPYAKDGDAQAAGAKLFRRECSGCHGEAGRGNGRGRTPVLASLSVREADPGTLFWILRNGSASHRMPSFSQLPEEQRWQIITYLQGLGDGIQKFR